MVIAPVQQWGTHHNTQVPWANSLSLPGQRAHEMGQFVDLKKRCWSQPAATLQAKSSSWRPLMHVHVCVDCLGSSWESWPIFETPASTPFVFSHSCSPIQSGLFSSAFFLSHPFPVWRLQQCDQGCASTLPHWGKDRQWQAGWRFFIHWTAAARVSAVKQRQVAMKWAWRSIQGPYHSRAQQKVFLPVQTIEKRCCSHTWLLPSCWMICYWKTRGQLLLCHSHLLPYSSVWLNINYKILNQKNTFDLSEW